MSIEDIRKKFDVQAKALSATNCKVASVVINTALR